jgi:TetR/AcrR family transcriptional regulator, cholesterol catabolism regulator
MIIRFLQMSMARPRRASREPSKSEASRRKILDAAARAFVQKGYDGTTLQEVAEAAGMQAGSLYYHFESEEFSDVVLLWVGATPREAVAALPPEAPFADRLAAAVAAHLEQLLAQGDYTSANIRIFGQAPASVRARQLELREAYAEWWRALLEDGRARGEVRHDADLSLVRMLLFGAMNWAIEWYDPSSGPVRRIAEEASALVLRGLSPR